MTDEAGPDPTAGSLYRPAAFAVDDRGAVVHQVRSVGFGHLVSAADGVLRATPLPFAVDDDLTEVRAHLARANPHGRTVAGGSAMLIVPGADAYVSPRWYPSKAEHAKVVPTWNYEVVHLHGTVEVIDDPRWLRGVVEELTDINEARVSADDGAEPWAVADAPASFTDAMLRAIVGVRLVVERVEAKVKLSQNRPEADRASVRAALRASPHRGDRAVAAAMAEGERSPGAGW